MLLNLNDAQSIISWWRVWPARHQDFLAYTLETNPQFAPAIREAERIIAADPTLASAWTRSVQERQRQEAEEAARRSKVSSLELRWQELAAAA